MLQRITKVRWSLRLGSVGEGVIIGSSKLVGLRKISIGANTLIDDHVILNAAGSKSSQITLGARVTIREFAVLEAHKGTITIGNDSFVGHHCILYGQGGLWIGNDTMIAAGTTIISSNHNFTNQGSLYRLQGETSKGVKIGNNSWLGANCTILDGVTLGDNSVVAAGSVVTKSWPENTLLAGVPAKPLKTYDKDVDAWIKA
jgi:acetyltransferase-like isoleucine patch superfamily enzyme